MIISEVAGHYIFNICEDVIDAPENISSANK
jgi:hypothetical protein